MKKHARRKRTGLFVSVLLTLAISFLASACGQKSDNTAAGNSANQTGAMKKSLNVANEAAAIRTLQTIFRAQTQFMLSHGEEYGSLDDLVKDNYLDQRFAGRTPVVEGYAFTVRLRPRSDGEAAAYAVNADPQQSDETSTGGARHLFMDSSSNVIRANAGQTASASDPPLQ